MKKRKHVVGGRFQALDSTFLKVTAVKLMVHCIDMKGTSLQRN